jgi:hypothetical protein
LARTGITQGKVSKRFASLCDAAIGWLLVHITLDHPEGLIQSSAWETYYMTTPSAARDVGSLLYSSANRRAPLIILMDPFLADKNMLVDGILKSLRHLDSIPCSVMLIGYLANYLHVLDPASTGRHPADLDKRILTRAFWFFTAPRSDTEMERLLHASCTCSALTTRDPKHIMAQHVLEEEVRSGRYRWPFQLVFLRIFTHIDAAAEHPNRGRGYAPHHIRIGYMDVWPQTLGQILPHGPENTIRGLVNWLKVDIGHRNREAIVRMINHVSAYTSQKTLPHIITSRIFMSCGVVPLLAFGANPPQSDLEFAENAIFSTSSALWEIAIHRCNTTHRRVLLESHAVEILRLSDQGIQRLSRMQKQIRRHENVDGGRYRVIIWSLNRIAGALVQDLFWWTKGKVAYKALAIDPLPHLHSFWARTLNAIEYSSEGQCCGLPDCMQTFLDTDPFRLCSGCRRVTYCSRRCQIRAWTHPAVPHREVCGTIHHVCKESGIPRIRMKVVKDMPKPKVFDEALGQSITEHFEAATRYRMTKFSSTYRSGLTSCNPAHALTQSCIARKASGSETCCNVLRSNREAASLQIDSMYTTFSL